MSVGNVLFFFSNINLGIKNKVNFVIKKLLWCILLEEMKLIDVNNLLLIRSFI